MVACTAESATDCFIHFCIFYLVSCVHRKHCRFNCYIGRTHAKNFIYLWQKRRLFALNWSYSFSFGFPHELIEVQSFSDYFILFLCASVNPYARVCWHFTLFWLDASCWDPSAECVCVFFSILPCQWNKRYITTKSTKKMKQLIIANKEKMSFKIVIYFILMFTESFGIPLEQKTERKHLSFAVNE